MSSAIIHFHRDGDEEDFSMRIFPTFISEFVAKFWLIPLVNDCQCGYITKSLLPNITIIQLYRKKSVLFKLHNCLNSSPFMFCFCNYSGVFFAITCFLCKYLYGSFRDLMTNHQQGVCHTCGLAIYITKAS